MSFCLRTFEGSDHVVLAETDGGAIAVELSTGAVWWLQAALDGPVMTAPAYRQLINSDLPSFTKCVESVALLDCADADELADAIAEVVRSIDPPALVKESGGVWHDAVEDARCGL